MELYAEFEPDRLLQFLAASQSYPLEPALRVAQDRGLIREQARRCLTLLPPACTDSLLPSTVALVAVSTFGIGADPKIMMAGTGKAAC